MAQAEAGETKGLVAEVRGILREMGRQGEWDRMEGLGKEGRKMEIRKWGREADICNWEKWQQTQKDIYRSTKRRHGEERYLRWGDRRAVVLKMLFRTGYANLRANKYEGRQAWCNLCDMKEAETEAHVLLRCPSFVAQRAELLYDLGQVWNADKLNRWSSLQDTDRVAAILSNEAEHRDTERAVDSAIKRNCSQT
jgi:hypothetical protein